MKGELNYRLRVADNLTTTLWWTVKRISVLAVVLASLAAALNFNKPGIAFQLFGGALCLLAINLAFYGMHRAFRSWRTSVEREWPDR